MEAPAALTTSSDQLDSCSSRTIETSTVTPSFSTVRDRPEWTRFGSRGFIVASISGTVLFHGGANYQPPAEVPMSAVSIFSPDAGMDVDVFHHNLLLTLAAVPVEGFEQCRVSAGALVGLGEIFAPSLERLFADRG